MLLSGDVVYVGRAGALPSSRAHRVRPLGPGVIIGNLPAHIVTVFVVGGLGLREFGGHARRNSTDIVDRIGISMAFAGFCRGDGRGELCFPDILVMAGGGRQARWFVVGGCISVSLVGQQGLRRFQSDRGNFFDLTLLS